MVQDIFNEFARFSQIEAMAIGGSRPMKKNDLYSDYDIYVYCLEPIPLEQRLDVLNKYCERIESDCYSERLREVQDNCIMKDGVRLDITYRKLNEYVMRLSEIVEGNRLQSVYDTCLWHSLDTCRIIYDKGGRLNEAKEHFRMPYPPQLELTIVEQGMWNIKLRPDCYLEQIRCALRRKDYVNLSICLSEFLSVYFGMIYALNHRPLPGDRNLLARCKEECDRLPGNLEQSVTAVFNNLEKENLEMAIVNSMVAELEKMMEHG